MQGEGRREERDLADGVHLSCGRDTDCGGDRPASIL